MPEVAVFVSAWKILYLRSVCKETCSNNSDICINDIIVNSISFVNNDIRNVLIYADYMI